MLVKLPDRNRHGGSPWGAHPRSVREATPRPRDVNEGRGVYDQDHDVLEAQQKAIDGNPRMPFYNLNIDAGALWARRKIDGMLRSEQGQSARPPSEAAE